MKKIIGVFGMAVLFMASTAFKTSENLPPDSCSDYAYSACLQESAAFGVMSFSEFAEAYSWYYNACMDAGGNIGDPVILD